MKRLLALLLCLFPFLVSAAPVTIYSGMTIDNSSLSLGTNNSIQINGGNANAAQTTVNGSAGSYIYSQPFTGSSYKEVLIFFNGYTNAGTSVINFPTAFTNTPGIGLNTSTLVISTISNSSVTIPIGTSISGWIQIVGY